MRLVVDLTLPTEARVITRTRRFVAGYLEDLGIEAEVCDDVALALAEACTNVMLHAFPGARAESFHVSAELGLREVRLVIEDAGIGLPPERVERVERDVIDLTATSGRGLHMIRSLMTDVEVEPGPEDRGTRLVMRRSL
jgi:serine/threonine-protein kinase RsbW